MSVKRASEDMIKIGRRRSSSFAGSVSVISIGHGRQPWDDLCENNGVLFSLRANPITGTISAARNHYGDVIMSAMASRITGVSIVCSNVCSGEDQMKRQSSASLVFVRGIHRSPVDSPHKGPVTRKVFPFDDVMMMIQNAYGSGHEVGSVLLPGFAITW